MTDYRSVEYFPPTLDDFMSHYWDDIQRIGGRLARETGVFEPDDISQAIGEEVCRRWPQGFSDVDREAVIYRLFRAGKAYIKRESIDLMYWSGRFVYSPRMVRDLLEAGFYESRAGETSEEVWAAGADIQLALEALDQEKREAILSHYRDGLTYAELGETVAKRIQRGVDDMTHALNKGRLTRHVELLPEPGGTS